MRIALVVFALPLMGQDYTKDVAPIFASNCVGCHGAASKMGGLDLESFAGLQKGGTKGAALVPGKASESRLYQMLTGAAKPQMPMGGKPLPAGDIELIRQWIDAGAKGPAPGEAPVSRATVPVIKPTVAVKPQIFSLAGSPDGKWIAAGGFKEVRLIDAARKTSATLSGHAETVRAVAFSPDGKLLAAAGGLPGRSGEVRIWNVESREPATTIKGHDDAIYAVAFSPDGKLVATSSYDKLVKLWDATTGAEVRTLKDHIDAVYALAFTPDGSRLISGSADRTLKVWDPSTGVRLFTLGEPTDGINTVAVDPSGKFVAAGGLDKTIRIWELEAKSARLVKSQIAHEDAILKIVWSPDGNTLISSAADKTVKVLRTADLSEVQSFTQPDWVYGLVVTPDGKSFAVARYDGTLSFYSLPAAKTVAALNFAR